MKPHYIVKMKKSQTKCKEIVKENTKNDHDFRKLKRIAGRSCTVNSVEQNIYWYYNKNSINRTLIVPLNDDMPAAVESPNPAIKYSLRKNKDFLFWYLVKLSVLSQVGCLGFNLLSQFH